MSEVREIKHEIEVILNKLDDLVEKMQNTFDLTTNKAIKITGDQADFLIAVYACEKATDLLDDANQKLSGV